MIAVMASTLLAVPVVLVPQSAPAAAAQPEVPCPHVVVEKQPPAPEPPEPPEHEPGERELGGEALATAGLVVPDGAPEPPALTATAWLVADLDTGAVLGACAPHEYRIPASTQKLLLAATFLDELDPDQKVKVTREDLDIEPGSSSVGLVSGGVYTIETIWLGLLLNSGNEAANVLARLGGGDGGVEGGVRRMNEEAQRLGAYQTHAVTPSGLDGTGQFTSAYDLALIARPLFNRKEFRRYVATERTNIPGQPEQGAEGFQIQNDNGLLLNYPGALGGKTGFTDLARHSFVGAAKRDGRRLVVTLLGAEFQPLAGWQQGAELLDWGFALPAGASVGRLVEPEELVPVTSSTQAATVAPPVAAPPEPGGSLAAEEGVPVNAGLVAAVLAGVGVSGVVLLLIGSRRRRSARR